MTTEYKEYRVFECDFGASTSLAVKIEDGKITESLDTSSYETNYAWDGGFEDGMLNGKTKEEAEEIMDHWFDDFEDEYRTPRIQEHILDARDWTKIKAQRLKEEKDALKRRERCKAEQEHKDVLAKKEKLLKRAERKAWMKLSSAEKESSSKAEVKDKARFEAYKKFSQRTN